MTDQLDAKISEQVRNGRLPGVAAIALDACGKVLYENGFGRLDIQDQGSPPVTTETLIKMFSCTKLVTTVAALQLVEQGRLDMYAPASRYVPEIDGVSLLVGFNDDGMPILRRPAKQILVLHLFTHTAGFSYDFFDADTLRYNKVQPPPSRDYTDIDTRYFTPLLHEPGERYTYGISTDWLGFVVERITGMPLYVYIQWHIIEPLSLRSTGTIWTTYEFPNLLKLHWRSPDGAWKVDPPPQRTEPPSKIAGGGEYLYSTVRDYAQLLLVLANGGSHPQSGVQLLQAETVQRYLFTDMLPEVGCSNAGVSVITSSVPALTSPGVLLPGLKKGWSMGLMLNLDAKPGERSAMSGAWAGLGNLYYWIDPIGGRVGMVASSLLPFMDSTMLELLDALERAVYGLGGVDQDATAPR
jgi:methyl acetate hydrolase